MKIEYALKYSDSSWNEGKIKFDPNSDSININGYEFFTSELLKVITAISQIQVENTDLSLNAIEALINGYLELAKPKEEETENVTSI